MNQGLATKACNIYIYAAFNVGYIHDYSRPCCCFYSIIMILIVNIHITI